MQPELFLVLRLLFGMRLSGYTFGLASLSSSSSFKLPRRDQYFEHIFRLKHNLSSENVRWNFQNANNTTKKQISKFFMMSNAQRARPLDKSTLYVWHAHFGFGIFLFLFWLKLVHGMNCLECSRSRLCFGMQKAWKCHETLKRPFASSGGDVWKTHRFSHNEIVLNVNVSRLNKVIPCGM